MKPRRPILKVGTSDWKIVVLLALPIFGVAMWYGISHQYRDIGLYAIVMALASWGVSGLGCYSSS